MDFAIGVPWAVKMTVHVLQAGSSHDLDGSLPSLCEFFFGVAVLRGWWGVAQAGGRLEWALPEGFRIQFEGEQAELFIGGVYVRHFLKNSQFPLRHPKVRRPANPTIIHLVIVCPQKKI